MNLVTQTMESQNIESKSYVNSDDNKPLFRVECECSICWNIEGRDLLMSLDKARKRKAQIEESGMWCDRCYKRVESRDIIILKEVN